MNNTLKQLKETARYDVKLDNLELYLIEDSIDKYYFITAGSGNKHYPGPWSYTYEDPSQNPIHSKPGGMGNNKNLPEGWNNAWLKAGLAGFGAYKIYKN